MVYMSQAFRNACRAMGINLQPSHEGSPWEKGSVETSFSAVGRHGERFRRLGG
jgi:hypothetical protein